MEAIVTREGIDQELRRALVQDVVAGRSTMRDMLQAVHRMDGVEMDGATPGNTALQCRSLAPILTEIATASANIGAEVNNGLLDALAIPEYISTFKPTQEVLIEADGGLKPLPEGGRAAEAGLNGSAEVVKLARFGASVVIDETTLIDAGRTVNLLVVVPRELARRASRIGADWLVWHLLNNTAMADGVELFHTDRGNTGSSALDATTLAAARAALKGQSDGSGVLDLDGRVLLTAAALGDTGRKLLTDSELTLPEADRLAPLASARLDAGISHPVTGEDASGSTTAWYLFADPRVLPAFKVYYLAGTNKGIRVAASALTQGRWGVHLTISLDLCIAPVNPLAVYRGNV